MSGKLVGTVTLLVPEKGVSGADSEMGSSGEANHQKESIGREILTEKYMALEEHQQEENHELKKGALSKHKQDTELNQGTQTQYHSKLEDNSSPNPIFHQDSTSTEPASQILNDVQLWGNDNSTFSGLFSFVSYVNVSLIPLYLISGAPCRVYTTSTITTSFFQNHVASCVDLGGRRIITKTNLVFYTDTEHNI